MKIVQLVAMLLVLETQTVWIAQPVSMAQILVELIVSVVKTIKAVPIH